MNEVSVMEQSSDFSKVRFRIHPLLLFSSVYTAGLIGLFEILRTPKLYGLSWDQNAGLILFSFGGLIAALTFILANRTSSKSSFGVKVPAITVTAIAALAFSLFLLSDAVPTHSPTIDMSALFLVSCSMPFALFVWMRAYMALNFRSILLNSGLAYILCFLLLTVSTHVFIGFSHLICAMLLLTGSIAMLFIKDVAPVNTETIFVEYDAEDSNSAESVSIVRFLTSIPIAGIALYAITTGLVVREDTEASSLFIALAAIVLVAAVLIFVVVKLPHLPDHRLMFYIYGFGLSAIAGVALIIKMIPIDIVSSVLFREFMKFYFQILAMAAWAYLAGSLQANASKMILKCGALQLVISVSLLIGFFVSEVGYPFNTTFLGLITASFLLFAMVTIGRNIILFVRGSETADELIKKPYNVETVCTNISLDYKLSPRETDVLKELAYGHSSSYVAKVLFISNNTARTHMKNIYKKLDINSREDLLRLIRDKQEEASC